MSGNKTVLVGKATIMLDDQLVDDLATEDVAVGESEEDLVEYNIGKDFNVIICLKYQGFKRKITLRVLKGQTTDAYLSNKQNQFVSNPATYKGITFKSTMLLGDGTGSTTKEAIEVKNCVVSKVPGFTISSTGNEAQAILEYELIGTAGQRGLE